MPARYRTEMAIPVPQSFSIYKGDTFLADGLYRSKLGDPVDLITAGITIEAWLKGKDNRRFPIAVTYTAGVGTYHLEADTALWSLGRNQLVVRYTQGLIKRTAQPVVVNVEGV